MGTIISSFSQPVCWENNHFSPDRKAVVPTYREPQPSMSVSGAKLVVLSVWEGLNLSITATLLNYGCVWAHACKKGTIVLSSKRLILSWVTCYPSPSPSGNCRIKRERWRWTGTGQDQIMENIPQKEMLLFVISWTCPVAAAPRALSPAPVDF